MSVSVFSRVLFFVFDFLMPLGGVVGHFADPQTILSGFTSKAPLTPPAVETQVLLDGMAGWYAGLMAMHLYLQFSSRAKHDRSIWNLVMVNLILVDLGMLIGFTRALLAEGRLYGVDTWRTQDYANIVGYTVIALVRLLFVLTGSSYLLRLSK
eukprot:TRINITY_DN6965_c0_g1_i1.p1 TRINITY_DN6965_c0_g1~~TRINITY_DN6965_c0_g1_i1.p1  ORF type:complete len:153 (-),score=31.91 TRINITY_DN6965_c0_g1_i1:120-578(-)